MNWQELLNKITPRNVLRWGSVLFVLAMYVLIVVATILTLVGVFT